MFPGKVGYVRKVMLIANSFMDPTDGQSSLMEDHAHLDSDSSTSKTKFAASSSFTEGDSTMSASAETASSVTETASFCPETASMISESASFMSEAASPNTEKSKIGSKPVSYNLFTTPETWPNYSDRVDGALKSGNILADWDVFIAETAYFILKHHDMKNPSEYDDVGRLLSERWPCIRFEEHGKNPWNHFVKRLSQKIRNIRWSRKRKLGETRTPTEKRSAVSSAQYSFEDDEEEQDNNFLDQLLKETNKENPDKARIASLQKKTFSFRKLEKKIYPFLLEEKFMKKEFYLRSDVNDSAIQKNWDNLISTLEECAKQDKVENTNNVIPLLEYLEAQIAVTKRMKKMPKPAITVEKATYVPVSLPKEAPRLVIILHGELETNGFLLYDGHIIELNEAKGLMELVLSLLQAYYAWDLTYPIQYQILGFLQLHLLKDKHSPFKRSCNFLKFQKRMESFC